MNEPVDRTARHQHERKRDKFTQIERALEDISEYTRHTLNLTRQSSTVPMIEVGILIAKFQKLVSLLEVRRG